MAVRICFCPSCIIQLLGLEGDGTLKLPVKARWSCACFFSCYDSTWIGERRECCLRVHLQPVYGIEPCCDQKYSVFSSPLNLLSFFVPQSLLVITNWPFWKVHLVLGDESPYSAWLSRGFVFLHRICRQRIPGAANANPHIPLQGSTLACCRNSMWIFERLPRNLIRPRGNRRGRSYLFM